MSDDQDQGTDDGAGRPQDRPARPVRSTARDRERDRIVAELDARLTRHAADVADVADVLGQALPRLDDLGERVGEIGGRLDELAGTRPPAPPPNPPVHWPALSADAARVEWERLAAWIANVLGPWYAPTRGQLPDCWPRHRRAVVTLSWLRTAYVAAYAPDAAAHLAGEWHARWLPVALDQISDAIPESWCRPGTHLRYSRNGRRSDPTRPAEPHERDQERATGTVQLAGDPSHPRLWGEHWQTAVDEDVERRRQIERAGPGG